MGKATSETHQETSVIEREITGGHHHVTRISDGQDSVERRGSTAEEAESRASDAWNDDD